MNAPSAGQVLKMPLSKIINYFNEVIKGAENLCSLTRSSKLQREECSALDLLLQNATLNKHEAIRQDNENVANLFLGFECVIGAVRAQLMMLILLKQDKPNESWEQLVAAQMGCLDATRAHTSFTHCGANLRALERLEREIFPPQVFMSTGFIADSLGCSICDGRYGKCGHLRGKPYMGEFCEVIHRNIRGDHAAITKTPADKRCRVVSIKTKGGHLNKLSCEISPLKEGESLSEDAPLEVTTVLFSVNRYPYLMLSNEILGLPLF